MKKHTKIISNYVFEVCCQHYERFEYLSYHGKLIPNFLNFFWIFVKPNYFKKLHSSSSLLLTLGNNTGIFCNYSIVQITSSNKFFQSSTNFFFPILLNSRVELKLLFILYIDPSSESDFFWCYNYILLLYTTKIFLRTLILILSLSISEKMVQNESILSNKHAGRNFFWIFITNEQGGIFHPLHENLWARLKIV